MATRKNAICRRGWCGVRCLNTKLSCCKQCACQCRVSFRVCVRRMNVNHDDDDVQLVSTTVYLVDLLFTFFLSLKTVHHHIRSLKVFSLFSLFFARSLSCTDTSTKKKEECDRANSENVCRNHQEFM